MKKMILFAALALVTLGSYAQTMVVPSGGFFDNWSIGLNGGATMALKNQAFFKSARPVFGLSLNKQWTPILGTEIQGLGYINTSKSATAVDGSDVSLLGKMNLMNLIGGYQGTPRFFEMETVTGIGWLHHYMNGADDSNDMTARMGLNFNLNLGESKAWTLSFKTAMVFNLTGNFPEKKVEFDMDKARFEALLGLVYHIPNSMGEHSFAMLPVCDPVELEALNDVVNELRSTVAARDAELVATAATIAALEDQIASTPTEIDVAETVITPPMPETIITFKQGSAEVENLQLPDVEMVANYMKTNTNAKILIYGYASPEGNADFNQKLSQQRADKVKQMLMDHYQISADRITAEGKGIGEIFPQPTWNRLSVCVINIVQ